MNTFLMWLGGFLIAILAALFAVPHFIDWNGYRGVFEEEASRVFGRDVRVRGSVNVRILPTPYVRFEKLRIADTSGITGAPLFSADSFTMWLSVPPLLKGVFEARQIEIDKPVVRFAIDRSQRPNWVDLTLRSSRLPIAPGDISLQDVNIRDGEIAYDAADAGTLARITDINGSLSASGLQGPYAFRGLAKIAGEANEVRFATGEIDDAGSAKLRVVVQRPDGSTRHMLDGTATSLYGRPSFKGALTSTLKLGTAADAVGLDARAAVSANISAAELSDLVMSFENVGQPQIITGKAGANWGARHTIVVDLNARWLDLDRLSEPFGGVTGSGAGNAKPVDPDAKNGSTAPASGADRPMPLPVARRLFAQMIDILPDNADLSAQVLVDQVRLGGDAVSNLTMLLSGRGGPLQLRSLTASLPGGARFDFSGALTPGIGGAAFDGNMFVGGPSIVRVMQWAVPGYGNLKDVSDGPFSVSGRLRLGADLVALSNATGTFADKPLSGSVRWQEAPVRQLTLELDGYEIDSRWVGIDRLRLADFVAAAARSGRAGDGRGATAKANAGSPAVGDGSEAAKATAGAAVATAATVAGEGGEGGRGGEGRESGDAVERIDIKLRAGRLVDGADVLKNIDARLVAEAGAVTVSKLSFDTIEGLRVSATGEIRTGGDALPEGAISYELAAASAASEMALSDLLLRQGLISQSSRDGLANVFSGTAPFRLSGKAELGGRLPQALDLTIDGFLRGRRVAGSLLADAGLQNWRSSPIDLHLDLNADDIVSGTRLAMGRLGPAGSRIAGSPRRRGQTAVPGLIVLEARGIAERSLHWLGDVRSKALDLKWSGQGRLVSNDLQLTKGQIKIVKARAADLLSLGGLSVGQALADHAITGRFVLSADGPPSKVDVEVAEATLAGVPFDGALTFRPTDSGVAAEPFQVAGTLNVQTARLDRLMDGVLGDGPVVAPVPRALNRALDGVGVGDTKPIALFSTKGFDFGLLETLKGNVGLRLDRLGLADGLVVRDAVLQFGFDGAGTMDVAITSGGTDAGTLSAELKLAKAGAGARLDGSLALSGSRLERVFVDAGTGPPVAKGGFDLKATFAGRGLTPRAMAVGLQGQGVLSLSKASLAGLSPNAVASAAERLLALPPEETIEDRIVPDLEAALSRGRLALGSKKVPFRIAGGAATFSNLAIRTNLGQTQGQATLDLATLLLDSSWRVTAASQSEEPKPDWPQAEVVFAGPLNRIARLSPSYDLGAFARELSVRRLERNAKRLEEIRAEDERRAEEARLRAEEAERQRLEAEARARAEEERLRAEAEEAERVRIEAERRQREIDRRSQGGGTGSGYADPQGWDGGDAIERGQPW